MMKLLALTCLFTISTAFGPGPMMSPPASPEIPAELEDFDEDDVYFCWFYINCLQFGKEEHKRIETCFDHLDEADSKLIYSWYDGALQNYTTLYDGLWDIICMAERNRRDEGFKTVAMKSIEVPSVGCEQRYNMDTCEHFRLMMECTTELFAVLKKEGKCEQGEFEDGS
ncbi:uncharacterized protein LOC129981737 [Argiope bruennichi]|uniref:uncharacterized protein LOC129981737 n=1 Tax=Argiope bruennichi TaxID=94029 RepID=UPI0024951B70|nr:uncharacterized protein LOC129981737 [Argiope bruennichi]